MIVQHVSRPSAALEFPRHPKHIGQVVLAGKIGRLVLPFGMGGGLRGLVIPIPGFEGSVQIPLSNFDKGLEDVHVQGIDLVFQFILVNLRILTHGAVSAGRKEKRTVRAEDFAGRGLQGGLDGVLERCFHSLCRLGGDDTQPTERSGRGDSQNREEYLDFQGVAGSLLLQGLLVIVVGNLVGLSRHARRAHPAQGLALHFALEDAEFQNSPISLVHAFLIQRKLRAGLGHQNQFGRRSFGRKRRPGHRGLRHFLHLAET